MSSSYLTRVKFVFVYTTVAIFLTFAWVGNILIASVSNTTLKRAMRYSLLLLTFAYDKYQYNWYSKYFAM